MKRKCTDCGAWMYGEVFLSDCDCNKKKSIFKSKKILRRCKNTLRYI